jgi:hypothetical protein
MINLCRMILVIRIFFAFPFLFLFFGCHIYNIYNTINNLYGVYDTASVALINFFFSQFCKEVTEVAEGWKGPNSPWCKNVDYARTVEYEIDY